MFSESLSHHLNSSFKLAGSFLRTLTALPESAAKFTIVCILIEAVLEALFFHMDLLRKEFSTELKKRWSDHVCTVPESN